MARSSISRFQQVLNKRLFRALLGFTLLGLLLTGTTLMADSTDRGRALTRPILKTVNEGIVKLKDLTPLAPQYTFNPQPLPEELKIVPPLKGNGPRKISREQAIDKLYRMGHYNWLDYIDSLDDDNLAPLTKEAQRWIYEWQNPDPSECHTKKFLISNGTEKGFGLGAHLHKQGHLMTLARETGRIYILAPTGHYDDQYAFSDPCPDPHDPTRTITSTDCITQPVSSCGIQHATPENSIATMIHWETDLDGKHFDPQTISPYWEKRLDEHFKGQKLSRAFYKIWWRGQSAAYLSRLNAKASDAILSLRMEPRLHTKTMVYHDPVTNTDTPFNLTTNTTATPEARVPYPLPPNTINLHVRHGDKGGEMSLIPLQSYLDVVDTYSRHNPYRQFKRIFVSSEDPQVISDARTHALTQSHPPTSPITEPTRNWEVYTSHIQRIDSGPFQQMEKYGRTNMTMQWYLQLWMGLECDGWVGTRGSNWNRIIDEFRCIYVDKCQLPYWEVGPEKDWVGYFW